MAECKRCNSEQEVLYQCPRCFIVYCAKCPDTKEGKACPKCGMGARLVLSDK